DGLVLQRGYDIRDDAVACFAREARGAGRTVMHRLKTRMSISRNMQRTCAAREARTRPSASRLAPRATCRRHAHAPCAEARTRPSAKRLAPRAVCRRHAHAPCAEARTRPSASRLAPRAACRRHAHAPRAKHALAQYPYNGSVLRRTLIAAFTFILAVSCSREARTPVSPAVVDENAPQEGGTLIRRLSTEVATLNPVVATSRYDRLVMNYIFTPVVYFDSELRCIPGLATRWEISSDGLIYTFHLDPKATFSDGTPVRASDVLFTLKKIVDPAVEASQVAGEFDKIDIAQTRAVDDHTLVVAFKEAFAPQLAHFNDVLVLPEHVYSKGDFKTAFNFNAVGSGPYRLVRRSEDKDIVLERREDYWGKKPYLKTVVFKTIVDDNTAWNAVKRGDVDESQISADVWMMSSTRPELQKMLDFRRFYYLAYNTIAWNNRGPILSDKRVRLALAKCVDMKSMINNFYHGTARAMNGPFTPDQWAYNPNVPVIEFDPLTAKRELNAIGWLDTDHDGVLDKDHKPLKIELLVTSGNSASLPFAQLLEPELKKIGVVLTISQMDSTAMLQRILAGNFDS